MAEIDDPAHESDFATGTQAGAGGSITTFLRLEGPVRARIGQVLITGDFFVAPPRIVLDLEAHLKGRELADAEQAVLDFFAGRPVSAISVTPAEGFAASLRAAFGGAPA